MLSDTVEDIIGQISRVKFSALSWISNWQLQIVLIIVSWVLWRLWKFTIVPTLWKDDPVTLPYAIPLIGHTISFLKNPEETLKRGSSLNFPSKHFPGTAPFALNVGGYRIIIIRNPDDVRAVWKDSTALTFDYFIETSFKGIGVPARSFHVMFQDDPARLFNGNTDAEPHFVRDNPNKKRYIDIQEDWIREQVGPGSRMNMMADIFLRYVGDHLLSVPTSSKIVLQSEGHPKAVSLYNWCRYTLVESGTRAFLGKEIYDLDPDFVQHYIDWEETSWKVAHQHPAIFSRDMQKARQVLMLTMKKYYALEPHQRPNLSWIFERMQSEQQALGLKLHEAASISIIMLWGIHLNTFRMLFWTLTHILSDPKLKQAVISETAQARQPDGQFSVDRLINHCPTLTAVWNECLRFYNAAAVIRCAEKHTVVGSKTVRPGDRVLGPFRLMHLSNDIFGPNSNEFDAYRWLRDKSLATKKGYYPFGGGHTYCPGRVVAKQEVCFFIATVLDRFEITPLGPKKDGKEEYRVPGISSKPVLTAMDPDADYLVSVSLKEA